MPNVGEIIIQTGTVMRERDADDFYQTDEACLRAYFNHQLIEKQKLFLDGSTILDPGCGTGVYGKVLQEFYPNSYMFGVEKNYERFPNPGYYDVWIPEDYLTVEGLSAHAVIGNPPYKLAEKFFWQALKNIQGHGHINFLLRLGFLESERRYKTMWSCGYKPTNITVLNTRPSFTGNGKTYPTAFAFFDWHFIGGKCDESSQVDFLVYDR